MYISRHMTKSPITVSPAMLLPEARALLNDYHFNHLPVVDSQGVLVGMLSDRDLRSAYPSSVLSDSESRLVYEKVEKTEVSEIMSSDSISLTPDSTLDDALYLFDRDHVGALPVLEDGQVVGIFSVRDLTSAYKLSFGVGEKGAVLIGLEDDGTETILTRLVTLLEKEKIPFTRILRIPNEKDGDAIYIRVSTFKIAGVLEFLKDNGFSVRRFS